MLALSSTSPSWQTVIDFGESQVGNHYLAEFALQISFIEGPKSSNDAGWQKNHTIETNQVLSQNRSREQSPKSKSLEESKVPVPSPAKMLSISKSESLEESKVPSPFSKSSKDAGKSQSRPKRARNILSIPHRLLAEPMMHIQYISQFGNQIGIQACVKTKSNLMRKQSWKHYVEKELSNWKKCITLFGYNIRGRRLSLSAAL